MAVRVETTEKTWEEMTPDEKLQKRIDAWLAQPIDFVSAKAEADYKARINRFLDAITLRKVPDRVPVLPGMGPFAQHYYGHTQKDMLYDADKVNDASMKATLEFQTDQQISCAENRIGEVMDILNYKQYNWPGHGVPDDGEAQFIEGEYMSAAEYDAFMRDPTDFWYRFLLPRTVEALEPFAKLSLPTYRAPNVGDFGRPEIQNALKKLMEAGDAQVRFQRKLAGGVKKLKEMGYPVIEAGTSSVPYDFIGDALRGTRGISVDMFKCPDKLLEVMDWATDLMIERGLNSARMGGAPVVGFALHKGSDPYLSEEHFQTFYWPQWRKVMEAFNKEGLIVRGGCQGFHNKRLATYATMPRGSVYWNIGYGTDIALAKKTLSGIACISGNVHAGLLHHASPEQVIEHCKSMIDIASPGGGYIFSTSSMDRNAKVENVKAMIKTAKEYGVYR